MRTAVVLVAALVLCGRAAPARAQLTDPADQWRTIRTEHFAVHFPASMSEWTLPMVQRLEAVQAAVERLVGYAPPGEVDLVVADPFTAPNGSALPYLDHPMLILWATPPSPRVEVGEHRGWSELLAVHEYGHVAHLTRPSRNPLDRALWSVLSPLPSGPLTRNSPRWLMEGYATYVEGRLTGSGRPHGVWRPTVLRQWALEGKLPAYDDLNETEGYRAGSMAYLTGSAFLEWLVEQRGEQSLRDLWRHMSARQRRGFSSAFSGVFGGTPDDLYGRFTAELTARAVRAREALRAAGLQTGQTVQKLEWETGDPALSADGEHVALVRRDSNGDSRVVVWKTAEEPEDSAEVRRRQRRLERDPEDVPDIEWKPRPREAVAVLHPATGFSHREPRFLPDGKRILVVRSEPRGAGQVVPDLFVWDHESGGVERITSGAAILSADPAPDGRSAVGVRCRDGVCDLVRIDLASGAVERVLAGAPERVFYRPRVSPDGRSVVVAVQQSGRWRVALLELGEPRLRYVDPDDGADRYDAAFSPDGASLVVVSHRTGIPNLERIDLATGAVAELTRVTGAALAPEPSRGDGSIYFLSLHAEGLDLNRLPPQTPALAQAAPLSPALAPAAPSAAARPAEPFALAPAPAARAYGFGPRRWRWALAGSEGPEGESGLLAVTSVDPVGRLSLLFQAGTAREGGWSGGSAGLGWRGWGSAVRLEAFIARQDPSEQEDAGLLQLPPDLRYAGGVASVELARQRGANAHRLRAGASVGSVRLADEELGARHLAFAELSARFRQSIGPVQILQTAQLHGSAGTTAGSGWQRWIVVGALGAGHQDMDVRLEATHGRTRAGGAGFERFSVGGSEPLLMEPAVLSQRISMPALPVGLLAAEQVTTARASASPLLGLRPYVWAATTDAELREWYRAVGLESRVSIDNLPIARLGGVRVVAGAAYLLDDPFRNKLTFYSSVAFRP